jgi:hypothetical protein
MQNYRSVELQINNVPELRKVHSPEKQVNVFPPQKQRIIIFLEHQSQILQNQRNCIPQRLHCP